MLTLENLHVGDVVEYNIAEGGEAEDWVDCTIDLEDLLWLSKSPKLFNMFHRRKKLKIETILDTTPQQIVDAVKDWIDTVC